jgi:hypothetical protein
MLRLIQALGCCVALASCNTSTEVKLKPHCYASTHSFETTGVCECAAFADEASFSSIDWDSKTSCSASELPPSTVCCAQFGGVSSCACAKPQCFVGVTGECSCGVISPTSSSDGDGDDSTVTDCNPDGTLDCCNFGNGECSCTPGSNGACDSAGGTHVADCTVADASVECTDNGLGLSMQVASCEDVKYECTADADCDETCSEPSCARCLTTGKCLCGTKNGSKCSY